MYTHSIGGDLFYSRARSVAKSCRYKDNGTNHRLGTARVTAGKSISIASGTVM